ncbi:SGNH/GDSL hydrolase family protein [Roseivirga thermotolerans]|uniref:SGNH/GDSL hydrolase family protein n=1 Tax=Roseivirga thermotolerans TaxID=1758176 RepID=UPI00273FCD04|nr:SGNH/GDSL hydrolase family protein [Roseivirga thermotolerans]
MRKYWLVLLTGFHLLSGELCAQKVLFVGNSLTYSNKMPQTLEALARENGHSLATNCLCYPNYGLEDHLNDKQLTKELAKDTYNFVIFQQGPSSQAYGRETLFRFGRQLAKLSEKHQAKPVYLMVWPSLTYYHTFDGVVKNYSEAADSNKAGLIALGTVWQHIHESNAGFDLYGHDGFHPSSLGSLLEAIVILAFIHEDLDIKTLKGATLRHHFDTPDRMHQFLGLIEESLLSSR